MPGRTPGGGVLCRPALRRPHRGMVTVELAIGMVTAVMVTAGLAGMSLVGVAQAACAESAAQLARQSARNDDVAFREAMDRRPGGAQVELERQREGVETRVSIEVSVLGVGPVRVSSSAWAAYEPGVAP